MRIGAKSLTSVALLLGTTAAMLLSGRFRSDYLAQLNVWVATLASAAAVVVGTIMYQYWRMWERSETHFALSARTGVEVGRGGSAMELPPWAQRVIYIVLFLWLALLPLNNRAIAQLVDFPRKIGQSQAQYCPVEEPEEKTDDPMMMGCELVIRAYALGYAKSLGPCAPEDEEETAQVCLLRQADEPYLHYAWRLFTQRTGDAAQDIGPASLREMTDRFNQQSEYLGELVRIQRDSIVAAPRASHHLFTNLSNPRGGFGQRIGAALNPGRCLEDYGTMTHLAQVEAEDGDELSAASVMLNHVYGQLLFNPAYEAVTGYCREYWIHWEAPDDACERLSKVTEEFLDDRDALDPVSRVLARRERARIAQALTDVHRTSAEGRSTGADDPKRIVSFQCLVVGATAEQSSGATSKPVERDVSAGGHMFRSRELRVPAVPPGPRGQIEIAKYVASLLAPGFGYGRLVSHEALPDDDTSAQTAELLRKTDYLFTKLELLRDADVFLGHHWIDERPDLLEIYPYHLHLQNFIEVFRAHYSRARGRL